MSRFLHGALRLRPASHTRVLTWDLAIVLAPFEPIKTLITVFSAAITSLKRVGHLQALSVAPLCLEFAHGMLKVFLHPRPWPLPKEPTILAQSILLPCSFSDVTPGEDKLALQC